MHDQVARVISFMTGLPVASIKPEDNAATFDMDSLDEIETIMALEEEFEIEISDMDAERCKTVGDLTALVTRLKGGA